MNNKEKYWLIKQAQGGVKRRRAPKGSRSNPTWRQSLGIDSLPPKKKTYKVPLNRNPASKRKRNAGNQQPFLKWVGKNVAWNQKDNVYGRATAAQENWDRLSPYHDALYSSSFKDQLPARSTGNEGMWDQLGQAWDFSNLSKPRQELMANPRLYNNIENILGTSYGEDGKLGALDPSKAQGNLDYLTWAGNQVNSLSPQGKSLLGALSPGSDIPTDINMNTLANMSDKQVSGIQGLLSPANRAQAKMVFGTPDAPNENPLGVLKMGMKGVTAPLPKWLGGGTKVIKAPHEAYTNWQTQPRPVSETYGDVGSPAPTWMAKPIQNLNFNVTTGETTGAGGYSQMAPDWWSPDMGQPQWSIGGPTRKVPPPQPITPPMDTLSGAGGLGGLSPHPPPRQISTAK